MALDLIHVRSVDPFSSYQSENVNRLTRMVTSGENAIAKETDLFATKLSNTQISISDGVAIKDDVVIHVTDPSTVPTYQVLDITEVGNYVDGSFMPGPFISYAYLVLIYTYVKQPVVPVASIKLLKDWASFDPDTYVFLAKVNFSATDVILNIEQDDLAVIPAVERNIISLSDTYTDTQARAAQLLNPIIKNNTDITWLGVPYTITHNYGLKPIVQATDAGNEPIMPIVVHVDVNEFTVDFDTDNTVNPSDFTIIY